mmetsp:Transcript_750/g.3045  ORF Transcript_750/g.3045 Transcript_750/m.3045 type:complete len:239 (+) Transcript_750:3136-3852(+)
MRPTQMGLPKLPRSPFVERVARSKGFTLVLLPGIHFPGLRPFFKEAGFSGGHLHLLLAQRRLPLHKEMLLRDDDVAEQRLRGHDAADIANPQADVTASVADVRALPGGGVQAPVHETIGHELVHLLSCTILDVHIQRFLGNGPRLIAGIRRGLRRGGRGIAVRSLGHLGRLRIGNESNHVLRLGLDKPPCILLSFCSSRGFGLRNVADVSIASPGQRAAHFLQRVFVHGQLVHAQFAL